MFFSKQLNLSELLSADGWKWLSFLNLESRPDCWGTPGAKECLSVAAWFGGSFFVLIGICLCYRSAAIERERKKDSDQLVQNHFAVLLKVPRESVDASNSNLRGSIM